MTSTIHSSLAVLLLFASRTSAHSTSTVPCTGGFGCEEMPSEDNLHTCHYPLYLDMTTDGRPEDVLVDLICNNVPVWKYPSDDYPLVGAYEPLQMETCLMDFDQTCCEFTIGDATGDGMMQGHTDGMFTLTLAGQELLGYDSLDDAPYYDERRVSFGGGCGMDETVSTAVEESVAEDEDDIVECAAEETKLSFSITLDDKPEETSWYLLCEDDNHPVAGLHRVWDVSRGALTSSDRGNLVEEQACLTPTTTCAFALVDGGGDGHSGAFQLVFGETVIAEGFGTDVDQMFCIGHACGNQPDEPEDQATSLNTGILPTASDITEQRKNNGSGGSHSVGPSDEVIRPHNFGLSERGNWYEEKSMEGGMLAVIVLLFILVVLGGLACFCCVRAKRRHRANQTANALTATVVEDGAKNVESDESAFPEGDRPSIV